MLPWWHHQVPPGNLSFLKLIHLLLKNSFPSSLILPSMLSYLFSPTIFCQILKPCCSQLPPCFFLPSHFSPVILHTLSEPPMVSEDSEPDLIDLISKAGKGEVVNSLLWDLIYSAKPACTPACAFYCHTML